MDKKQLGRPKKLDFDKLIGRRFSLTQSHWDTIDDMCVENNCTFTSLIMLLIEVIKKENIQLKDENQDN